MKTVKMNIDLLKHPEKNPRKHPEKQIKEMKRSIEMFGQYRPIVVDENNTILAGNGLVVAMREMGKKEADVLKYENLTESQKKKLMIADNQVAALGVDDYGTIEEIIKSIDKDDLNIPGYDDETLAMIVEESQTAIEEVNNYGIYNSDEVERLKEVEREREEHGFTPVEQTFNQQPSMKPINNDDGVIGGNTESMGEPKQYGKVTSEEVEKYVICPHCGEKIYI